MLKQTKDYSHYSYEQISELVKHNKKLAQIIVDKIKKLFGQ